MYGILLNMLTMRIPCIRTSLFYEGFTVNYTVTCNITNNIQFIYSVTFYSLLSCGVFVVFLIRQH